MRYARAVQPEAGGGGLIDLGTARKITAVDASSGQPYRLGTATHHRQFARAVVTPADRHHRFTVPVRLVELAAQDGSDEPIRLLTNRLDLPAELIGQLYRHRWQIELFFRWIKCVIGLKHFFSESSNGMALQLYVAMIGTLLIALETGSRPNKYDSAQMNLAAAGWVSLEEAKVDMARRRAERTRTAEWQAQNRAAKKAAK